jgi:multidrug efflux system membrane fusion protein
VKVQRIERQTLSEETEYSANIAPDTQVSAAFRVGGYVDRLMLVQGRALQEGDAVQRGAVLAVLREADFATKVGQATAQQAQAQAALAVAKSQLTDARVNLENAQVDFTRAKNLFATQSMTKTDLDRAEARALSAQAKVDAAQGQVQSVEAQIAGATQAVRDAELAREDSSLKAPIAGVVLKKAVEAGSLAAPGVPAFVIANTTTVKAVFGIPDTVVSTVRLGQALSVRSEAAPGAAFRGRVSSVAPSADPKSRAFDVEVSIPNPNNALRVGMIATVNVGNTQEQSVLVLPLSTRYSRSRATENAPRHG